MDEQIESIKTHKDLAKFISDMVDECRRNPNAWENNTLESFLEALSGCVGDMAGYYKNFDVPFPANTDWKRFAMMLSTAQIYE